MGVHCPGLGQEPQRPARARSCSPGKASLVNRDILRQCSPATLDAQTDGKAHLGSYEGFRGWTFPGPRGCGIASWEQCPTRGLVRGQGGDTPREGGWCGGASDQGKQPGWCTHRGQNWRTDTGGYVGAP